MNIKAYFLKRVRKNIFKYRLLNKQNSAITIMCYYQRGAFFLSFLLSFPLSFFLSFFISTLIELIVTVRIDQNEDEFIKMVMS